METQTVSRGDTGRGSLGLLRAQGASVCSLEWWSVGTVLWCPFLWTQRLVTGLLMGSLSPKMVVVAKFRKTQTRTEPVDG